MIKKEPFDMDTRLNSPDLPAGHDLYPVLSSAMKHRSAGTAPESVGDGGLWPPSFFGLDRSGLFRQSSGKEQSEIVDRCCRGILQEAYFIEKCGMFYTARMSLLSETTQERMLYSMFAADEAVHFNWIGGYLSEAERSRETDNPFIRLLDEILKTEDRATLNYIVQIFLEGWGISHYHALAGNCRDEGLQKILENIIRDEGRHHASGLILFNERRSGSHDLRNIAAVLAQVMGMVQAGPQMVVSHIEAVKGPLSRGQKIRLFEELECETTTARKIGTLKTLIRTAACSEKIIDMLERSKSFRPFTASECASIA